jgi:Ni/Fe-hydrogenase subunit HybB-like protein
VAPQLEGLESAFTDPRLRYDYFPGATEWLVAMFVGTIVLGLFYLGYRLLPLVSERKEVL